MGIDFCHHSRTSIIARKTSPNHEQSRSGSVMGHHRTNALLSKMRDKGKGQDSFTAAKQEALRTTLIHPIPDFALSKKMLWLFQKRDLNELCAKLGGFWEKPR